LRRRSFSLVVGIKRRIRAIGVCSSQPNEKGVNEGKKRKIRKKGLETFLGKVGLRTRVKYLQPSQRGKKKKLGGHKKTKDLPFHLNGLRKTGENKKKQKGGLSKKGGGKRKRVVKEKKATGPRKKSSNECPREDPHGGNPEKANGERVKGGKGLADKTLSKTDDVSPKLYPHHGGGEGAGRSVDVSLGLLQKKQGRREASRGEPQPFEEVPFYSTEGGRKEGKRGLGCEMMS